ncbi:hypothetical protein ACHAXR_003779 [Thalassiosira sp. AJA248-18]
MPSSGSSAKFLLANPAHGPAQLNKTDLSDGFYRVDLNLKLNSDDAPKLGVVFPTKPIDVPLILPMGWKNSPPVCPPQRRRQLPALPTNGSAP